MVCKSSNMRHKHDSVFMEFSGVTMPAFPCFMDKGKDKNTRVS